MNFHMLHIVVSVLIFLVVLIVNLFSLLVFDITQSLLLFAYLLVFPIIATALYPTGRGVTLGRQGAVYLLVLLPVIGCLVTSDNTRERMLVMVEVFASNPSMSYETLELAYRSMPLSAARSTLTLPGGVQVSQSSNWQRLRDYEEQISQ